MTFYTEMQNVVKDVMNEFAQGSINLVQVTPGAGPLDNPGSSITSSIPLDASVTGVSLNYVNQRLALETDLMVVSSVVDGVTPTERDFVEVDGVKHKIVKDVSTPAAGVKVAWKFIIRKGG